jgi:hypothetical protein
LIVDAVRYAIEVQAAMLERNAGVTIERPIEFRIGIHTGDVVEERATATSWVTASTSRRAWKASLPQFERYLQAQTFPNKATAKLICDFRVDEAELYRDPGVPEPRGRGLPPISESLFPQMIRPPSPSIAGGTYFAYSSIPHHPDPLMRSVTFVRREAETGHLQKGHRMVGTAGSAWAQARGNHHGRRPRV